MGMTMNAGQKISWKGDAANEPKSGLIEKVENGLIFIIWDNGKRQSVPDFTILPHYGWRVS